jgi:hypothetical protein
LLQFRISQKHANTTDTYTDDWWENATVASCRLNLNTRYHVCVLCMHKTQISVRRSDNLNVMLNCLPHSPSKFHANTLHIISIPNQCISSHSIPLNINTKKFIPKHIQPTAVFGSLLDPIIITKFWYELQDYSQTTSTDTVQYFTLYKLDKIRCGKLHFYSPLFFASAASTTEITYLFLYRLH